MSYKNFRTFLMAKDKVKGKMVSEQGNKVSAITGYHAKGSRQTLYASFGDLFIEGQQFPRVSLSQQLEGYTPRSDTKILQDSLWGRDEGEEFCFLDAVTFFFFFPVLF